MNRRGFLSLLGMGAAATVAPKFFFAPIGGWKSDVIAHPESTFTLGGATVTQNEWLAGKPVFLYGLPYYYSFACSGSYLGIERSKSYKIV